MKTCRSCNETKPGHEFTPGLVRCKACRRAEQATPEYKAKRNARLRLRYSADDEYRRKYLAKDRHKTKRPRTEYKREYRRKFPEKHAARRSVRKAVKRGLMPHPSTLKCFKCGAQAKDYHHHKGYSLEHRRSVVPICDPCHRFEGRKPR